MNLFHVYKTLINLPLTLTLKNKHSSKTHLWLFSSPVFCYRAKADVLALCLFPGPLKHAKLTTRTDTLLAGLSAIHLLPRLGTQHTSINPETPPSSFFLINQVGGI
jgi:hypothetical protein